MVVHLSMISRQASCIFVKHLHIILSEFHPTGFIRREVLRNVLCLIEVVEAEACQRYIHGMGAAKVSR